MRRKKTTGNKNVPAKNGVESYYPLLIWLVFAAGSLIFIPQCLDRYLVPRFFFQSAVLLLFFAFLRKDLRAHCDWRLHIFDLLLLAWYGLNLASVFWAFSWSEAVFYTQKVLLLFLVYWLVRQALRRNETTVRQAFRRATVLLSFAASGILAVQLTLAIKQYGLDNAHLYEYASGVFGNKSLASDFMYFLLVFNVLFYPEKERDGVSDVLSFRIAIGMIVLLILLLQTRTVYLALAASALVWLPLRVWAAPESASLSRRIILSAGLLFAVLLAALTALNGSGGTLSERLNPLTYLESGTAAERRFVWYKTDLLNTEHVWLGVGNGSWKIWFPSKNIQGAYRLQEQNVVFTRVHNDYLEVRSEMGVIGITLFCALFGAAFLAIFFALRDPETEPRKKRDLPVLATGLLGYCIIQFFDFPRERIECQIILAILFGYIAFHTQAVWDRRPGIGIRKFSTAFIVLASLGLLFNLVIGWNRMQGEIHNVRLLDAQARRNFPLMLSEARKAGNRYYEYNDVVVPLSWYEGIAHYEMNQSHEAAEAFGRAYLLNPWSFQVINNYASALVQDKRYPEAVPLFEKTLDINPRFEDGKFNLSFVCFQMGDYAKALDWLSRVDTIAHPQTEEARLKNTEMLKRKAEFRKAIEEKMK